jgi:2-polyprenyl-6-methoxyphenol hydroxylase-like FAD-dependent oxidoreductase
MSRATDRFDVAIIGAGPAGIAAAVAAAESGSVILIEASDRLGGSVTAAMHRSMCGLYSSLPKNPLDTLNDFAQRDLVRRMMEKDRQHVVPRLFGQAPVLEFPRAVWESALADMCAESKADLRLSCRVLNVKREKDRLTAIQTDKGQWISVKVVIDCTGGGHLLRLAGEDAFQPPNASNGRILGGYSVRLVGIIADPEMLRLQIPFTLAKAVNAGKLPATARFTAFYPGPAAGEGICKLALDPAKYSAAEAEEFAESVIRTLVGEISGLEDARIAEKSPRVLPRDGLRLRGRYTVSEGDILRACRHGPDAVHAWWPIEKWDVSTGPTYAYPPPGRHYDIPPNALRSETIANLLAAGTCISATAAAQASTRASGICLATGYAAGRLVLTCRIG